MGALWLRYSQVSSVVWSLVLMLFFYRYGYRYLCYFAFALFTNAVWRILPPWKIRGADDIHVVILGSGLAGLCSAIKFEWAGISYQVLEKAPSLGGTWMDNTYPGAGCDVPAHLYCFSFYPNPWWSRAYARQDEIWRYLCEVANHFRIFPHIRFNTEVTLCQWNEDALKWTVSTADGEQIEANFVVSGCGVLRKPRIPDFKGLPDFKGPLFHTSQWDHTVDLSEKRVAVIGTGASAIQLVPEIVDKVKELYVVQRTPAWIPPRGQFKYPRWKQLLFALLPPLLRLQRWYYFWQAEYNFNMLFQKNKKNFIRKAEDSIIRHKKAMVKDQELVKKLVPEYDLGCKRIVPSDDFLSVFNKRHVHLVTSKIDKLTPSGLKTSDEELPLDVIVLATGFDTIGSISRACKIIGRHGRDIQMEWCQFPSAFKGVHFPNFPNFFFMLGPNTGLAHNSAVFMAECQTDYVLTCIRRLLRSGHRSLDVTTRPLENYQAMLQRKLRKRVFTTGCASWYMNARGLVWTLWPSDLTHFWWITRRCNLAHFNLK